MKDKDSTKKKPQKPEDILRELTAEYEVSKLDLKRIEDSLYRSAEFTRILLENAPDRIFAKDNEGRYILMNKASYDFWGIPYGTAIGKTDLEVFDEATAKGFIENDRKVLKNKKPLLVEQRGKSRDGKEIVHSVLKAPLRDKQGRIIGLIGISRDITKQKEAEDVLRESEERFRMLFELSPDGIAIADIEEKKLQYANPALCRMLGYTEGELNGKSITEIHPRDKKDLIAAIFDSQARGDKVAAQNIPCVKKDGKIIYADINPSPPVIIKGKKCLLGYFRDVTEKRLAEEKKKKREARVKRQREAIIQLATDKAVKTGDFSEAMRRLTETVSQALEVERVGVWLFEENRKVLRCIEQFNAREKSHSEGEALKVSDYPRYFEYQETGRVLDASDARKDPRTSEFKDSYLIPFGITSMLDASIRVSGEVVGMVCHEHTGEKREWEADEIAFAGEIADQAAQIIISNRRRQAEQAVRESQRNLQTLFNSLDDFLYITDIEGNVLRINPAVQRRLGYTEKELVGAPDIFLHPFERQEEAKAVHADIREGRISLCLIPFSTKYGTVIPVETKYSRGKWGGKDVFFVVARDVTDRKRAEEALQKERDRAKTYIDIAGAILLVIDADQTVSLINKRGIEVLGYEEEEIVGKNWFDNFIPPKIRDEIKKHFQSLIHGKTESVEYFENPVLTKSGEERIVEWHNKLIRNEFGNIIGTLSSGEDITEKKRAEEIIRKSEEKYRTLTENLNVGVYRNSVELEGKFIEANPALVKMFGFKSKEELLKIKVIDIYQKPEDRKKFLEKLLRKGFVKDEELQFKKKDGTPIIGSVSALAVKDEKGEVKYCDGTIEDITQRKKDEEKLRFAQFSVDRSADTILWIDSDARIFYCSDEACRHLGYTREELLTLTVPDINPNIPKEIWKDVWERDKKKGAHTFESTNRRKDGSIVPVEITVNYLEFEGKEYHCTSIRDITERKKSEEKLRLTQFTIERASDAAFWIDRNAKYVYVNEAFCRLLGYSKEEFLSMTVFDVNPNFPPEIWKDHWHDLKKQGGSSTFESVQITKDGRVLPVEISANILEFKGKEYNCGFVRDITERKKAEEKLKSSEERFRGLTESTSDWIWEVDNNGRYTYASPKVRDILGYEPDEVMGKTPFDFMEPEEAKRLSKVFGDSKKSQKPFVNLENINLHKNGQAVVLETSGVPVFDSNGQLMGYRGIDRDITERKKTEEELRFRIEFEELITSISTKFINLPTDKIDRGIDDMLKTIGKFFKIDRCYVFQFHDNNKKMDNTHEWCAKGIEPQIQKLKGLSTDVFQWFAEKIMRLENVHLSNIANLPPEAKNEKEEFEAQGIRSLINIPLIYKGSAIGFLGFDSVKTEKTWSEDTIALLKMIGEIIVNVLMRKKADEEILRKTEQLKALYETSKKVAAISPTEKLLPWIAEQARRLLDADECVYRIKEGNYLIRGGGTRGGKKIMAKERLKIGESLSGIIVKEKKPLTIENVQDDKRYIRKHREAAVRLGLTSFLGVPMMIGSDVIGVINVFSKKPRKFTKTDIELLTSFADHTAIALEKKRLFESLETAMSELEDSERTLKEFSGKILSIREEEKKELSRNLHDDVGYMAIALNSSLSIAEKKLKENDVEEALKNIGKAKTVVKQSTNDLKNIAADLRPPVLDVVGLPAALKKHFSNVVKSSKLKIDFTEKIDKKSLDDNISITLYRIAQEALNNVINHAGAKKVRVRLFSQKDRIRFTFADDGFGFDVKKRLQTERKVSHIGIIGMRERIESLGGKFSIKSAPKKGTEISISIPVKEKKVFF